jgi:cell division protein FtsL
MSSNAMISLRPENVIRHIPWRLGSKTALGFVLLLTLFSLVGWLYLTQASSVTATSYQIDELRMELDHIKNQNAALILEIAELEALSRVEKRALELGFQPANDVRYVHISDYPMPDESEETIYGAVPVEMSVDDYVDDVEGPGWWVEQLDMLAALIERR